MSPTPSDARCARPNCGHRAVHHVDGGYCELCARDTYPPHIEPCPAFVPPTRVDEAPEGEPDWSFYRGSVRVIAEIRNLTQSSHVADRAMLDHWVALLEAELADDLRARIPALTAHLAALEQAKRVSRATLDAEITI